MKAPTHGWLVAALAYSDRLAKDELRRAENDNTFRAEVLAALCRGRTPEEILADVRATVARSPSEGA